MSTFEPESSSPFLRISDEPLILPDSNPLMEQTFSHSSHDEDDALRAPPEQVQKLSNELDKMGNWLSVCRGEVCASGGVRGFSGVACLIRDDLFSTTTLVLSDTHTKFMWI